MGMSPRLEQHLLHRAAKRTRHWRSIAKANEDLWERISDPDGTLELPAHSGYFDRLVQERRFDVQRC